MVINDWISVSPDNGCGEKTVTITLGKNETGSSRTYQIPVYFDDGSVKYITVNQPACGVTPTPDPICEDALVWGTYELSTLDKATKKLYINGNAYTPTVDANKWALCSWTGGTITSLKNFMSRISVGTSWKDYKTVNFSSSFDTSKVTNMFRMFTFCGSLESLDVTGFNTSQVTTMEDMFNGCSSLTSLDLSSFNTSQVTHMLYMFSGCSGLTSLDLSNFDTGKVVSMSRMFDGCSGLTSLDLSSFNTENAIYTGEMFRGCSKLTELNISNFDMSKTTSDGMFTKCNSLTTVKVINCDSATQQKILTQLQTDLSSHTWALSNGIITRS